MGEYIVHEDPSWITRYQHSFLNEGNSVNVCVNTTKCGTKRVYSVLMRNTYRSFQCNWCTVKCTTTSWSKGVKTIERVNDFEKVANVLEDKEEDTSVSGDRRKWKKIRNTKLEWMNTLDKALWREMLLLVAL